MSSQKNEKKKHTRKEGKVQTYNSKSTHYTHPPIFPPSDIYFAMFAKKAISCSTFYIF